MTPPPLCYLSADAVRRALPMCEAIEAMRDAFAQISRVEVELPTRLQLPAAGGALLVMPCHSKSAELFSTKLITVFEENARHGLPMIQSMVFLADAATGSPIALLDGASLTAIRTGAASGLATDLLARSDATTAAVIGGGVQARTQLEAVCQVRDIKRARVYDLDAQAAERFAGEMQEQLGVVVEPAKSPAEAVKNAGIVCTATNAKSPVFEDCHLEAGTHINAVGAFRPDMIEVPAATVCRARVVVDHLAAALEEAGDLLAPLRAGLISQQQMATELGDLVLGTKAGRSADNEITLFKSVGVAIQDLCAAARAVDNARELGLGTPIE